MMDFLVYAAAYLIGSIPMGRLLKKGKKGSAKQLKFVLDMAKGAAAVTLARLASPHDESDWVLAGFLAMMADEFPFYSKFKGVRGLGVMIGVFTAILGWLLAR